MPKAKTPSVTQEQAEQVLRMVAVWMGTQGYGEPSCRDGKAYDPKRFAMHADGTDCDECLLIGPAPTGEHAAYRGEGPMLRMDWDWPGRPTPTIILEGGPDDWPLRCFDGADWEAKRDALRALGVFAEPYSSYALCLYPA